MERLTVEIANRLRLIRLDGGTFRMGDATGTGYPQERPARQVRVAPFWIGSRCVTVAEYLEFMLEAGESFDELWCDFIDPCFVVRTADGYQACEGAAGNPMVQVSFVGAAAYCNARSRAHGLEPVYDLSTLEADLGRDGLRLPTEAEWEFAAGGPEHLPYGHGGAFDPERINCKEARAEAMQGRASEGRIGGFGLVPESPVPAGSLPPNGFGLHEMLGNVNEWCHDRYAPYPAPGATTAPRPSSFRVIRGGSFLDDARATRASYRHGIHSEAKCMIDGFRIAANAGEGS